MKKTKITKIPAYPTQYYDNALGDWVKNDTFSHADYDGEVRYVSAYDENGKHIGSKAEPITYIENLPWKDTLTYDGYYRGRSAAGATFRNDLGQRFTVFMTDFDKFIPLMVNGKIEGKFIYCKRGSNYGVTFYDGEI